MARVRHGDEQAFNQLQQRYVLRIAGFFRKHHVDDATVDDLTQEVFLRVWEKREDYRLGTEDINYLLGFSRIVLIV
ncbi:RNA polymerase sigma factor [Planctomycetota bacterium]